MAGDADGARSVQFRARPPASKDALTSVRMSVFLPSSSLVAMHIYHFGAQRNEPDGHADNEMATEKCELLTRARGKTSEIARRKSET